MFYVATVQSGARVLVSGRSPNLATEKVEKRLNTRVVEIDILEAVFYSEVELNSLAYILPAIGDSP